MCSVRAGSVHKMRWLLVVGLLCVSARASQVRKCGTEDAPKESPEINLSACAKLPCRLKRTTTVDVELKFKPERDVNKVIDSVHAKLLGIPFPFIGVDGNSVCDKIFDPKGAKVACPLKKGEEYVYKDSFKVLEVYPKIKVWVHWALVDERGDKIMCFEVPVKITS